MNITLSLKNSGIVVLLIVANLLASPELVFAHTKSANHTSGETLSQRLRSLEERVRRLEKTVSKLRKKYTLTMDEIDTSLPNWSNQIEIHPGQRAIGDSNAPVKITEFIDFECPFCRRYQKTVFPKIRRNYIARGIVFYKVRHFPLTRVHKHAFSAAVAAECALRQKAFWQYRQFIFNNFEKISQKLLLQFSTVVNLPEPTKYEECVREKDTKQIVKKHFKLGRKKGIKGTPSFIINGDTIIRGAKPYEKFKETIELSY